MMKHRPPWPPSAVDSYAATAVRGTPSMQRESRRRTRWTRTGRAGVTALAGLALASAGGCGEDGGVEGCPQTTEELHPAEVDLYRQLEVCAGRVTGITLHRDDLPRVETDPALAECDNTPTGLCVTTPEGARVAGFYLPDCDTFSVAVREVLFHEMVHPILCGVPDLDCDPGHTSPVWQECQMLKQCPDGRILLAERLCDGTPDCAQGEDELQCP